MAKDYFIIECEGHPKPLANFAKYLHSSSIQRWRHTINGCVRGTTGSLERLDPLANANAPKTTPEDIIWLMDRAGCDMAAVIGMPEQFYDITDNDGALVTNREVIQYCDRYPDRLILCPNFAPSRKGVNAAIREMEILAKTKNCKVFKFYPPDEWPINDRRLWPFYEKAQDLGMTMQVHTGMGYVYRGSTFNSMPIHLEEVCQDFWDLKIVAFHMGWPWSDELNVLAGEFPNLYISVSFTNYTINWKPRFFAKLLGEAINWATVDKIIWGCGGFSEVETIENFKKFQFPEDLQEGYGFKPLTEDDKAKIFGLNFAYLLGIEPTKRAKPLPK